MMRILFGVSQDRSELGILTQNLCAPSASTQTQLEPGSRDYVVQYLRTNPEDETRYIGSTCSCV